MLAGMRIVRANEMDEFNGDLRELAGVLAGISDPKELERFLREICTATECLDLAKRWALMKDLLRGKPQRAIAAELHTSLCKITRGARYAKSPDSLLRKAARDALDRGKTAR